MMCGQRWLRTTGASPQRKTSVRSVVLATLLIMSAAVLRAEDRTEPNRLTSDTEATSQVAPLNATDVVAWLDGLVPYAIEQADIAGAVVIVVKNGQTIALKGYGYADVDRRLPIDPASTMFRMGSVSKLVTWTAVMQLVEQGKLDLDRNINAYVDFAVRKAGEPPITLRHLMTHTAGFEEAFKDTFTLDPTRLLSLRDIVTKWVPVRIFSPGTTPAYSSYGTALAGYVVQRVSGEPFDEYVERHVFAPLGMTRSTFRQPLPEQYRRHMSSGYLLGSEAAQPFELIAVTAAGSMTASAEDIGRFMVAHLHGGRLADQAILKPATADAMHGSVFRALPVNGIALGFMEQHRNGHRIIGHTGDTFLFHTALHLFLDDDVGLYIGLNSTGKDGGAREVRRELFERFADRYFPPSALAEQPTLPTASAHAQLVAGRYQPTRRAETSVMRLTALLSQVQVRANADGTLSFERSVTGRPRRWREIEPFVWRDVDGQERLAVRMVDGHPTLLGTDRRAAMVAYQPVPWWKSSALVLPALAVSLLILAVHTVLWLFQALRRGRARHPQVGFTSPRSDTLTHAFAAAALFTAVTWWLILAMVSGHYDMLSTHYDWLFVILQAAGFMVLVGACVALNGLALSAVAERSSSVQLLWRLAVVSALLTFTVILWVAGLIGSGLNY